MAAKFNLRLFRQILGAAVIVPALAAYPLTTYGSPEVVNASIIGYVLSLVNALLGYAAIELSAGKSYSGFINIVLGGIAVRLLLMAAALLVLIWLVKVHALALVVSLFTLYVIFLGLEVLYLHTSWQSTVQQSSIDS